MFRKQQWGPGFELLARGADQTQAEIATSELDNIEEATKRFDLAQLWLKYSQETNEPQVRRVAKGRAAALLKLAVSGLTGLSRVKADSDLASIAAEKIAPITIKFPPKKAPATPTPTTPEPTNAPGNAAMNAVKNAEPVASGGMPLLNDGVRDARWSKPQSFNLLEMVQVQRDQVNGDWLMRDGALVSPRSKYATLRFPIIPTEEYDLEVDVEPAGTERDLHLIATAPGGHRFVLNFNAYDDRVWNGIDYVDGKKTPENETAYRGETILTGKVNQIRLSVRRDGIQVWVNKKSVIQYKGEFNRLTSTPYFEAPDRSTILVGAMDSIATFHRVQLTTKAGYSTPSPRPSKTRPGTSVWHDAKADFSGPKSSQPSLFLDDVPETSFHVAQGTLGKQGHYGHREGDDRVRLNQTLVDHCLAMVPHSNGTARVTYELNGEYSRFESQVAITKVRPKTIKTPGKITFKVYGDGKLLGTKGEFNRTGQNDSISVDIAGVKTLALVIECKGSSRYARTAWLNPTISK
ncbi:MAG: NPCBM/NEW2 domain-containing protein [Planctomycetota bacterium]